MWKAEERGWGLTFVVPAEILSSIASTHRVARLLAPPILWYLTPSSKSHGLQACTWLRDLFADKAFILIK